MSEPTPDPTAVGQQLARRREELDITQDALARRIGITTASVSAAERGKSVISRGKRPGWERALHLKPGTLGRAYREAGELEVLDTPTVEHRPIPDLSDRDERVLWEMSGVSEETRRTLIEVLRRDREHNSAARRTG